MLYDYVKYEVSGKEEEKETETWEKLIQGTGKPSKNIETLSPYGWSSDMTPASETGNWFEGKTSEYQWTYNNIEYKLIHMSNIFSSWILYEKKKEITNVSLQKETNTNMIAEKRSKLLFFFLTSIISLFFCLITGISSSFS